MAYTLNKINLTEFRSFDLQIQKQFEIIQKPSAYQKISYDMDNKSPTETARVYEISYYNYQKEMHYYMMWRKMNVRIKSHNAEIKHV